MISDEATELIDGLLSIKPAGRHSVADALSSTWMTGFEKAAQPLIREANCMPAVQTRAMAAGGGQYAEGPRYRSAFAADAEEQEPAPPAGPPLPTKFVQLSQLETCIMAADKINAHIDELEQMKVRRGQSSGGGR